MLVDSRRAFEAVRTLWRLLPETARVSRPARALKDLLRTSLGVGLERSRRADCAEWPQVMNAAEPASWQSPPAPREIESVAELDDELRRLDAASSDDALREGFESFVMRYPTEWPSDPDSAEYRSAVLDLYARLHGKPYDVTNEISRLDPVAAADRPFPFQTGSAETVGGQLIALGNLIRELNLAPGSAVLELGAGWGNTAIALARMGHRVTALDIESNFVALIAERSRRKHVAIETIQGDFSLIDRIDRVFDAVVFFESFHHSSQPHALIGSLDRIVAPGGLIAFAGEPVSPDFPVPWGLRLDGQSLWAIRRQGWLELGFREDYFVGLVTRNGWTVTKSMCSALTGSQTGWGTVFLGRRTTSTG